MLEMRFGALQSLLCIGAHADDIEVGCGGTVLRLLAEHPDTRVRWVVLSASGNRAEEAAAGAERFLGDASAKEIVLKDFRDSFFPYERAEVKEFLHDLASEISPDLIFTHRREDLHQDHRAVSELTWCAFRDHMILEYEIPKYDGDLGSPNVFVPLSERICSQKVDSVVDVFRSQHEKRWFTKDTFRSTLRLRGVECNSHSGYAEGFTCRKLTL
jgi:LmbE family N-acetylglucosaminyl deacetylase